jgi:hypothetical protein
VPVLARRYCREFASRTLTTRHLVLPPVFPRQHPVIAPPVPRPAAPAAVTCPPPGVLCNLPPSSPALTDSCHPRPVHGNGCRSCRPELESVPAVRLAGTSRSARSASRRPLVLPAGHVPQPAVPVLDPPPSPAPCHLPVRFPGSPRSRRPSSDLSSRRSVPPHTGNPSSCTRYPVLPHPPARRHAGVRSVVVPFRFRIIPPASPPVNPGRRWSHSLSPETFKTAATRRSRASTLCRPHAIAPPSLQ